MAWEAATVPRLVIRPPGARARGCLPSYSHYPELPLVTLSTVDLVIVVERRTDTAGHEYSQHEVDLVYGHLRGVYGDAK